MEIKNKIALLFIGMVLSLYCSCEKIDSKTTTENRPCGSITTMIIYNNVDVILTDQLQNSIKVEAPGALIDNIETTIIGKTLTVRNNNKLNWLHNLNPTLKVWVNSDSLQYLAFYGTSKVYTETAIEAENFQVEIGKSSDLSNGILNLEVYAERVEVLQNEGYSDITLRGATNELYLTNNAFGLMKLSDLMAENVFVKCNGSNNTFVRAGNSLKGNLLYVGDLYYFGNPQILNVSVTGDGKLIHAE